MDENELSQYLSQPVREYVIVRLPESPIATQLIYHPGNQMTVLIEDDVEYERVVAALIALGLPVYDGFPD